MWIIFFILGIVLGSFYNVVIYRLPLEIPISKGRSMCTTCKTTLKPIDLVPVFSWLFLRGKCRYCNQKISFRYPALELLTGIMFTITYLYFGFGYELLIYLPFFSMLLITLIIDFKHMEIYHIVFIISGVFICAGIFLSKEGFTDHLMGALFGFAIYMIIYILTKFLYKKEAFGLGDVILLGAIGLALGVRDTLIVAVASFYIGLMAVFVMSMISKKINFKQKIPFGTYVCITAFIVSFYGDIITNLYMLLIKSF